MSSGKWQGVMDRVFAALDRAANNANAATRALIYDSAEAQGLSEVEAELMALENLNFSKRGLSATAQHANRAIPFFNVQVQALNVLAKAARGNMPFNEQLRIKRKFYNNALMLAGAGVAYAMAMADDEYYKNAKPRDRYTNLFLYLPFVEQPIKLPIPFEVGYFFSLGVAAVDAMRAETKTSEQFAALRGIFAQSIPGYSSMFLPQLIKPSVEVWANKSFFTGKDIETARQQGLEPSERYNTTTTEAVKEISKLVPILSPIQIEHIVRGHLGSLPLAALAAAQGLFAPDKVEATARASDMPLIGTAFQRKYGGADADTVHKLADEAIKKKATLNNMINAGRLEDARAYLKNNRAEIAMSAPASQYRQNMARLFKDTQAVRVRKDITPDEMGRRIDRLDAARQDLAARYLAAFNRYGGQP